jgi:RNA ligase
MINKKILKQYLQDGLLTVQSHPTLSLHIWNYTAKVQYENLWDEYPLLIECRGLVTDYEGNIISKGYKKFFNLEENRHTPTDQFEVYSKLDGQYIGIFWYNNELVVNSRGSFTSPYAVEAKRILFEKYKDFALNCRAKLLTYYFELVGFEQIVVKYDQPDLILTGIFHPTGKIEYFDGLADYTLQYGLNYVKKYPYTSYSDLKSLNWQNHEGFVVKFSNGDRCKIKFADYVRLHRQMTNLSTTAVWEALRDGKPVSSILNDVPDEFYDKVKQYENNLKFTFAYINSFYDRLMSKHETTTRKEFANFATKCTETSKLLKIELSPKVFFAKYDKNTELSDKLIWNSIKPKFEKI